MCWAQVEDTRSCSREPITGSKDPLRGEGRDSKQEHESFQIVFSVCLLCFFVVVVLCLFFCFDMRFPHPLSALQISGKLHLTSKLPFLEDKLHFGLESVVSF